MSSCLEEERPIEELSNHEVGMLGERIAASFVEERQGYRILERNWRCPYGEADIIATDDKIVYFIEVKTRLWLGEGAPVYPEVAVNEEKMARYERIIAAYLQQFDNPMQAQFDVAAVVINRPHHAALHYKPNAYVRAGQ